MGRGVSRGGLVKNGASPNLRVVSVCSPAAVSVALVRRHPFQFLFCSGGTPFGISPQTRGGALTRLIPRTSPGPPRTPKRGVLGGPGGAPPSTTRNLGGVRKNPKISYPFLVVSGPPFFDSPGGPKSGTPPDLAGPPHFWGFWGVPPDPGGGPGSGRGAKNLVLGEKIGLAVPKNFRGRSQNLIPKFSEKFSKKFGNFPENFGIWRIKGV